MAGEKASMRPGIEVILQVEVETKKYYLVRQKNWETWKKIVMRRKYQRVYRTQRADQGRAQKMLKPSRHHSIVRNNLLLSLLL